MDNKILLAQTHDSKETAWRNKTPQEEKLTYI